jgi:phospholipase C
MATTDKGTHALPHNPLTPFIGGNHTTYRMDSAHTLPGTLRQRPVSRNPIWGRRARHLGMLMPHTEYILISHNAIPYVYPHKPAVPIYRGTATVKEQQKKELQKCLQNLLQSSRSHGTAQATNDTSHP